mmetsp:Transcript_62501/g.73101  ORF Transcript_62501/g.73101 Transcript_62501/m.73101 type:complete len:288 (+) Transcript_62501:133-996(+)
MTMMRLLLLILTLTLITVAAAKESTKQVPTKRTYTLQHSFSADDVFTDRGKLILSLDNDSITSQLETPSDCLTSTSLKFSSKPPRHYKLKVIDDTTQTSSVTSVPFCNVIRSNFREEVNLVVGVDGSLISVGYTPLVSPLARSCDTMLESLGEEISFTSKVVLESAVSAMSVPFVLPVVRPPPGLTFFPRDRQAPPGKSDSGGIGEALQEEVGKSFIMKYWYIIAPVLLLQIFGGMSAPEEGAAPGAPGQAVAGAGAVASTAAVSMAQTQAGGTVSGTGVKRRGKRK